MLLKIALILVAVAEWVCVFSPSITSEMFLAVAHFGERGWQSKCIPVSVSNKMLHLRQSLCLTRLSGFGQGWSRVTYVTPRALTFSCKGARSEVTCEKMKLKYLPQKMSPFVFCDHWPSSNGAPFRNSQQSNGKQNRRPSCTWAISTCLLQWNC